MLFEVVEVGVLGSERGVLDLCRMVGSLGTGLFIYLFYSRIAFVPDKLSQTSKTLFRY
jgi:hypothetical protein